MDQDTQIYGINNEFDVTEILEHFDSNYIFDVINDKLEKLNFYQTIPQPNIVNSFEENFKMMNERFPDDSQNIAIIRDRVYRDIIELLTKKFNLQFNTVDDTINPYTAAYYLYEFLISKRNEIMINFFTMFIINNKDNLYNTLNLESTKKNRDTSSIYGKRIYVDQKYALISANMPKVINHIATIDISLLNIFQSTYKDFNTVNFLDNAFADKGNFFHDYYCAVITRPEVLPIVITNIKLALQRIAGNLSDTDLQYILQNQEEQDQII